jgi:hypothetical protein
LGPSDRLIKPVAAALILVVTISAVAILILPQYVYISPFSIFYSSGVVDHKSVGQGTDGYGNQVVTYTISVRLLNDDPVNRVSGGETLGYIVSKEDWDMIALRDVVKIELLPNAHVKVVNILPISDTSFEWSRQSNPPDMPINLTLTSTIRGYSVGENANFTVQITNDPALGDPAPSNVTLALSMFRDCIFYIFSDGQLIRSNDNLLQYGDTSEIQTVNLQPNESVSKSFTLNLSNLKPGTYYLRAYVGYSTLYSSFSITLTQTISLEIS